MNSAPIFFEFNERREALHALDTLEELGYKPTFQENMEKPTLHMHVDNQDLTSALEIAQAHGGRLTEREESPTDEKVFATAYDMEGSLRIPAHVVNEDWPEGYADSPQYTADAIPDEDDHFFDPSADDYNHFPPGIRL